MQFLKAKLIWIIGSSLFFILLLLMLWTRYEYGEKGSRYSAELEIEASRPIELQVFFSDTVEFSEEDSYRIGLDEHKKKQVVQFELDSIPGNLRFDFGEEEAEIKISSFCFEIGEERLNVSCDIFALAFFENDLGNVEVNEGIADIKAAAGDPYLCVGIADLHLEQDYAESIKQKNIIIKIVVSVIIAAFWVFFLLNRKTAFLVPKMLLSEKRMFADLTINDFQAKFAGHSLGVFWGFFQPFVMLMLYWFVFQVGLRQGNVSSYPFILFLMAGLIPWFYFSEALGGATSSLQEYSYLVKKVVFNIEILPLIKVVSSIFVHLFFVCILLIVCCAYGYWPDLYWIQLIYYIGLNAMLALGIGYIASACMAFFKDVSQIVNILLTVGVWITPIMWNSNATISNRWLIILFQLNPVYYIVDGFRSALLDKEWFWNKPIWSIYSILVVLGVYIVGTKIFTKLKNHFSDVL